MPWAMASRAQRAVGGGLWTRSPLARTGLYVGGSLTNASGVRVQNVARWDGTMWWPLGDGIPGRVRSLVVQGNRVYAGADPFRKDGTNSVYLSQWNGTEWQPIGITSSPALGSVSALAACGSDLYAGGGFVWMNGVFASRIAKWDGDTWSSLGTGIGGSPIGGDGRGVLELACTGSELFVGGYFQSVGGKASTNIALWHIPHSVTIKPTGSAVRLSWPATGTNFLLEATEDLEDANWAEVSQPPVVDHDECVVTNDISGPSAFYGLRRKAW
jgi:hypothetical protein